METSLLTPTEGFPEPVRHEWRLMGEILLRMPDAPARDLAKTLGYGYHTILAWKRSPAFQRYFAWLAKKEVTELPQSMKPETSVKDLFVQYEVEMAQRLVDIAQCTGDEKLAASIAQDWLDRAGHAPKTKDQGRPLVINIAVADIEMFKRRAEESGLVLDGNTVA